jgi:hypothetical protein
VYRKQSSSGWPPGPRYRSADARLLVLRVQMQEAWMSAACESCVLSCRSLRGLILLQRSSTARTCIWSGATTLYSCKSREVRLRKKEILVMQYSHKACIGVVSFVCSRYEVFTILDDSCRSLSCCHFTWYVSCNLNFTCPTKTCDQVDWMNKLNININNR